MSVRILQGDVMQRIRDIPDGSVHCIVTSPPYFGLRDYKIPPSLWGGSSKCDHDWVDFAAHDEEIISLECASCGAWQGCLGLEPDPDRFVRHINMVFSEIWRVLRKDGVVWLNLGDSYATPGGPGTQGRNGARFDRAFTAQGSSRKGVPIGLKPKDLMGIPWRVAFALQDDGWWLRQWLPWIKRNPMPESAKDRPAVAVDIVFMLTKSKRYFYDHEAVMRRASPNTHARVSQDVASQAGSQRANAGARREGRPMKAVGSRLKTVEPNGRNKNNVSFDNATCKQVLPNRKLRNSDVFYDSLEPPHGLISDVDGNPIALDVTTQPYSGAHFATFPPKLVEPLIRAACPEGGTVLDPFGGAGTTGLVADRLQRNAILIERGPENVELARERIENDSPGPIATTEVTVS